MTTDANIQGVVPIFPLPNAVFFPKTVLPLHVFEPRYRQMIRDVKAGDMQLAVTLLRGNWEQDYDGSPDLHTVATLGRVEDLQFSDDGRATFRLHGLQRVQLEEIPCDRLYRQASYNSLAEPPVAESAHLRRKKIDLMAAFSYLLSELGASDSQQLAVDDSLPFDASINQICASMPIDPPQRQTLLELDLVARMDRAQRILNELLQRVILMKSQSGEDDTTLVN